jgi:radical SAM superfamily enzyme YgiQ (UPF0313 family)
MEFKQNRILFIFPNIANNPEISKAISIFMAIAKKHSFDILHKHNISTTACFIVGFPYETREDIFKSIDLCRRINPDEVLVNIFQPLPG